MPKKVLGRLQTTILDNLSEAVIAIDREGTVAVFNRMASLAFNLPQEKVTGQKIWDALKISDFTRAFSSMIKDSEPKYREQVILFPNERIYLARLLPARGKDGRVNGAIAILKDLMEFHNIEKAMNQFLANVSHELKTPLTSIKGFVETLLEGALANEAVCRKFLQVINEETNRMTRLILSMLDMSSLDSRAGQLNLRSLSILQIINNAVNLLRPIAEQKGIAIEIAAPEDLPWVKVDEDRMMQVVINLLDNAIKFTGLLKKGKVRIEARDENKHLRVNVIDTGVGIPPEEKEKIFERFYRIKEGLSAELGGTGLGLAITKQIVEAHGGTIGVDSVPGKGSKFSFTVPLPVSGS